ncbi:hypothetical protein JCM33374_g4584 [Metschnikowia sp. JCM 33374]|nr:hypothetical protein JCM33374_g4584 [Metschnikowia sp. JCM 33374]
MELYPFAQVSRCPGPVTPCPPITYSQDTFKHRPISTIQFIKSPSHRITLPVADALGNDTPVVLEKSLAILLFENIKQKLVFYRKLKHANPDQMRICPTPSILVIECGPSSLKHALVGFEAPLFVNCGTPEELISVIKGIPENKTPSIGSCKLNTVVIENLSAFYWDKQRVPRGSAVQWYVEIGHWCGVLQQKYGCNVVVTMWDKNFERGFNSRPVNELHPRKLDDLSYTPAELFAVASCILAFRADGNLQYVDSQWSGV